MNNNQKLIDAVNCKFPQNNLCLLYTSDAADE